MTFTHATPVKQSRNTEAVEKLVNLVKNANISLSLGGDPDTVKTLDLS